MNPTQNSARIRSERSARPGARILSTHWMRFSPHIRPVTLLLKPGRCARHWSSATKLTERR